MTMPTCNQHHRHHHHHRLSFPSLHGEPNPTDPEPKPTGPTNPQSEPSVRRKMLGNRKSSVRKHVFWPLPVRACVCLCVYATSSPILICCSSLGVSSLTPIAIVCALCCRANVCPTGSERIERERARNAREKCMRWHHGRRRQRAATLCSSRQNFGHCRRDRTHFSSVLPPSPVFLSRFARLSVSVCEYSSGGLFCHVLLFLGSVSSVVC